MVAAARGAAAALGAAAAVGPAVGTAAALGADPVSAADGATGADFFASTGAAAALGLGVGSAPAAAAGSSNRISEPSDTLSPALILTWVILPASGAGTSIAAFSVSRVIRGVSFSICWPSLTNTSITLTSLKPPMSGTRTSIGLVTMALNRQGVGFF